MSDAIGDIAPAHLVQKTTDLEVMVKSDFECCMHAWYSYPVIDVQKLEGVQLTET